MKKLFVKDLKPDPAITGFFLVHEKEVRNTANGKPYLRMELGDRTGTVEARMWDQFEALAKEVKRDDFIKVHGRVEIYRNKPQLTLQQFRVATPEEIDLGDFLPRTPYDVEELYKQILGYIEGMKNPWLQQLCSKILTDPQNVARFKRAPAAKVMHHAYIGGLIEHVVGLCGLAKQIAAHYSELDVDLLLTAALLHDVGKLDELSTSARSAIPSKVNCSVTSSWKWGPSPKVMDSIEGFPERLKTVVQHLLISHHGEYEFGSPKLPMIREALAFHYMDDLDSKMGAIRAALASDSGEPEWSAYSGALARKFLRLDKFLKP